MFTKILVANRGEIAIRAFRAAYELGAQTVAVFPYEDRNSMHRLKADEAYQIGEKGHPVAAYLNVSEIIRVAKEAGADAIYPGYGFLSENPELAEAAAAAGITFIGPGQHVLEMAGNKVTAKEHAIAAGVPVLKSTPASKDLDALLAGADEIGSRFSPRRWPAAAAAACAESNARKICAQPWRRRCGKPTVLSATRRCSSSRRSCGPGTSRCRCSPTRQARRCTCSSAIVRCSVDTRR